MIRIEMCNRTHWNSRKSVRYKNIETLTTEIQLEVIIAHVKYVVREPFKENWITKILHIIAGVSVCEISKNVHVTLFHKVFNSTHLFQQTFSKIKCIKSMYGSNLSDEYSQVEQVDNTTKT